jgi:hypothetical protein
VCYDSAADKPRSSSRKPASLHLLASAGVGCLALGCVWTVYSTIFAASVYPRLDSADYDIPVVSRPPDLGIPVQRAAVAATRSFAALTEAVPHNKAPAATVGSLSFQDRFAAAAAQGQPSRRDQAPQQADATAATRPALKPAEPLRLAEIAKPKEPAPRSAPMQVAAIAPLPVPAPPRVDAAPGKTAGASVRDMAQRAKAAVLSITGIDKPSVYEKLWGKPPSRGSLLAYASADANITGSLAASANPALGGNEPRYDRSTAVYDISAHMVYLPDGSRLEAHSGLGDKLDDPNSAKIRMRGVTPPHLYELTPREALFHGVPALRLTPVGGDDAIYGRSGLLAHTYMLGPNGDSNGCVSFRDYNAFLNAFRNQGIKRLAVVARID